MSVSLTAVCATVVSAVSSVAEVWLSVVVEGESVAATTGENIMPAMARDSLPALWLKHIAAVSATETIKVNISRCLSFSVLFFIAKLLSCNTFI